MRLVFDIETNSIDFSLGNAIDQIEKCWCIVARDIDTNEEYVWKREPPANYGGAIHGYLKLLEEADELIGHNIIQFDLPALRKLFSLRPRGKITDTLVISRALYPDRDGRHSLDAWGARLGYPKGDFSDFDRYSPEMLEYCRQDVRLNQQVYTSLLREYGHEAAIWTKPLELEHRIADIIAAQERKGFFFDIEKAKKLRDEWSNRISAIDIALNNCVGNSVHAGSIFEKPFKISGDLSKRCRTWAENNNHSTDSIVGPYCGVEFLDNDWESKLVQKKVLQEYGWKPTSFTPKSGTPKLENYEETPQIGELLAERNQITPHLGKLSGLIDKCVQSRLHGGANPCGTNTHRMTHFLIANIPKPSVPYGGKIRSLFTVPAGKILLGYDAKGLEMRMIANYVGSKELISAVLAPNKSDDAHTFTASTFDSDDRDLGKTVNYALAFGARDARLAETIGCDVSRIPGIRQKIYERFPGLDTFPGDVKRAARRGFLIGLDGRKVYPRPQKSPINTLIQSGGAIFMKTSTRILDDKVKAAGLKSFKVADIHDEAQWECEPDEVETLTKFIHEAFAEATEELELRCPQEADIAVGMNWSETH